MFTSLVCLYRLICALPEALTNLSAEMKSFAFFEFYQIQRIKVKCRCQRVTTASAPADIPSKKGERKEDDYAEILFSLVELRRVSPR